MAKIDKETADEIRRQYQSMKASGAKTGYFRRMMAERYSVSVGTLGKIVNGQRKMDKCEAKEH